MHLWFERGGRSLSTDYDPLTWIVSLFLAADLARTADGIFITLVRQYGTRLPDELRNSGSFDGFKRYLQTILFSRY